MWPVTGFMPVCVYGATCWTGKRDVVGSNRSRGDTAADDIGQVIDTSLPGVPITADDFCAGFMLVCSCGIMCWRDEQEVVVL